jgi:hypothetical protein
MKERLAAKRFATDGDLQIAVISWLKALDAKFFFSGIYAMVSR